MECWRTFKALNVLQISSHHECEEIESHNIRFSVAFILVQLQLNMELDIYETVADIAVCQVHGSRSYEKLIIARCS